MGVVTSPCCPSPEKGEGMATSPCRSAISLSFARRGTFWRKPKQGEVRTGGRETVVSTRIATSPCLLRRHPSPSQGEGSATSPCCPSPSTRRGTFWRKPKQGEVRTGGQETAVSTGGESSPCQLRRHRSPSPRRGNCDLTLLSLSLKKERDVSAKAKTG
jgi:hypothetical protein